MSLRLLWARYPLSSFNALTGVGGGRRDSAALLQIILGIARE
jgi:hypothetical protein